MKNAYLRKRPAVPDSAVKKTEKDRKRQKIQALDIL